MKTSHSIASLTLCILLFATAIGSANAQGLQPELAVGQAFTYQGQLSKNGAPLTGDCALTFGLWDAVSGGSPVGASYSLNPVHVAAGVFTVKLNDANQFGANPFDGSPRFLEIAVQCAGDSSPLTLGRQELTAAPYASYALKAGNVSGVVAIANGGTGSSTQNFVDLSSSQVIGGTKTFTSAPAYTSSGAPFSVSNPTLVTNLNADLLDGQQAGAFQGRVTGTCSAGSTVKAVNADGSVQCEPRVLPNRLAAPQGNSMVTITVPGTSVVGQNTSIAIGADRLPVIAHNGSNGLELTHCVDIYCQTPNSMLLDNSGSYPSVAIGTDGLPVIAYYTSQHVYVIHCADAACSATTKNSIYG